MVISGNVKIVDIQHIWFVGQNHCALLWKAPSKNDDFAFWYSGRAAIVRMPYDSNWPVTHHSSASVSWPGISDVCTIPGYTEEQLVLRVCS